LAITYVVHNSIVTSKMLAGDVSHVLRLTQHYGVPGV